MPCAAKGRAVEAAEKTKALLRYIPKVTIEYSIFFS